MTNTLFSRLDVSAFIDTNRYPIHRPEDPKLQQIIAGARRELSSTGCAHLPSVLRPEVHEQLIAETTAAAPEAFELTRDLTPYGDGGQHGDWPDDHPRNRTGTMSNGFVGKDRIPTDTMIRSLYDDPDFKRFVAACLGIDTLHQFADPIRGLVINVMNDGTQMPWHYDANEFIVSLMTKKPAAGGTFEYCADLREPGDEHYAAVKQVLDGDRDRVRTLDLNVGDLQLFRGRYSLHRITPVDGTRHTVLFGYSETPGYIGGVESTRYGYGRFTQEHLDAAGQHTDGLAG
jgi:hypothetical protein